MGISIWVPPRIADIALFACYHHIVWMVGINLLMVVSPRPRQTCDPIGLAPLRENVLTFVVRRSRLRTVIIKDGLAGVMRGHLRRA